MVRGFLRFFKPKMYVQSITNISFELLKSRGTKGIILDLDNTLAPWGSEELLPESINWLAGAKKEGFKACLVSNNKGGRIARFAKSLEIPFIERATKPRQRAFLRAMQVMQTSPGETVVIGDQVFTDVLGGNRLGLYTILVVPISSREFFGTRLIRIPERVILRTVVRSDEHSYD